MTPAGRPRLASVVEYALAGPAILWFALALGATVAAIGGYTAATSQGLTLSEAAALRDRAELVRLIRAGGDARARSRVRVGIIREREYMLTPLEAATATQRGDVVELLVREGVPLDESSFPTVYCIAARSEFEDMVELLRTLAPDRPLPQCDNVQLPL